MYLTCIENHYALTALSLLVCAAEMSSAQLDAEIRDMQSPARGVLAASEESRQQAQKGSLPARQPGQAPQFVHGETLRPEP